MTAVVWGGFLLGIGIGLLLGEVVAWTLIGIGSGLIAGGALHLARRRARILD